MGINFVMFVYFLASHVDVMYFDSNGKRLDSLEKIDTGLKIFKSVLGFGIFTIITYKTLKRGWSYVTKFEYKNPNRIQHENVINVKQKNNYMVNSNKSEDGSF